MLLIFGIFCDELLVFYRDPESYFTVIALMFNLQLNSLEFLYKNQHYGH